MDLPSAYRRPKFRLEELERKEAAKITVGFLLSFFILIIVWLIIKVPMFNNPQTLTLSDCSTEGAAEGEHPPTDQPLPPNTYELSFSEASNKCVRASGNFDFEKDAMPIQYRINYGPTPDTLNAIKIDLYNMRVDSIVTEGTPQQDLDNLPSISSMIRCWERACEEENLAYIVSRAVTEVSALKFTLNTKDMNNYVNSVVQSFRVEAISTNPSFEFNELIIRYVFLVIATGVAAWFYFTLSYGRLKYPWHAWALEQKWTFILLILLIGFNNPLCWAKRYSDSMTKGLWLFVDLALRYTFLLGYMLAILSMIDHISQTKRKSTKEFYIPKLVLLGPLWLVLVMRSMQTMNTQEQALHKPLVLGFVSVVMSIYLLWLLALIAVMINKVSHAPPGQTVEVGVRFKMTWCLNLIMIVAIAAAVYRVNAWGVESTEFIFGYAGFNFYVFILAALFAPAVTSMPYRPPQRPSPEAEVVINDEYEVEGDY